MELETIPAQDGQSGYSIYYIDYSSLTGPYTQNALGRYPTWSPNNAAIMLEHADATGITTLQKINAFGTTATTVLNPWYPDVKWKR